MKEGLLTSGIISVVQSKLAKGHFGDTQPVELLRLGDGDAFAVLTRRYEKRLLRIAILITKNTEDSEDAVQEAFLKAYWRIETFRGQSSFSTWLTRIVINTCLMQLRKNRTRPHVSLDETNENGTAWVDYLPPRGRYRGCLRKAGNLRTACKCDHAPEADAAFRRGWLPTIRLHDG
ncbi:MAG: polymerase, sigma-24 subunit, subfamily [Acidobacteriaceae bacterium]|nr:polymerase, sigma-24 subunit, subfamily [Acidobacteriaceae bacterium]